MGLSVKQRLDVVEISLLLHLADCLKCSKITQSWSQNSEYALLGVERMLQWEVLLRLKTSICPRKKKSSRRWKQRSGIVVVFNGHSVFCVLTEAMKS